MKSSHAREKMMGAAKIRVAIRLDSGVPSLSLFFPLYFFAASRSGARDAPSAEIIYECGEELEDVSALIRMGLGGKFRRREKEQKEEGS